MDDGRHPVSVRPAVASDLAWPVVGGDRGEYAEQLAELVDAGAGVVLLVAESPDGRVVGRVGARTSGATAEILGLVVDPGWRRGGVGTALADAAETWSREQGCTTVRLSVGQDNHAALRLYDGRGYHLVGTATSPGLVARDGTVVHEPEALWVVRKHLG